MALLLKGEKVMKIGSETPSLRILSSYGEQINKNRASISSGRSINSASDNAAGLAISERMQSQTRGINKAIDNSQDGISLVQTAESALSSTHDSLQRMRELAVQSSNGTLSENDRAALNQEFSQLKDEISQTAQSTSFNGKKLLDGSLNESIDTGSDGSGVNVSVPDMSLTGLNLDSLSISSSDSAIDAIDKLDNAIESVSNERGNLGSTSKVLEDTISNLMTSNENIQASESQIADTDIAKASMELTKNMILEKANIAILAQGKKNAASVLELLK